MRSVFGLVLVIGVGLAGFAVYTVKNYMGAYQRQLAMERASRPDIVPTEEVFVAARPLRYGEQLTDEDVIAIQWPSKFKPEGVFTSKEELFPEGKPARFVLRAMETNEALMQIKVTEPGEDAGLTNRLDRGMRAFAIKVDVSSGVSGFLRPGDRVDVYWTGQVSNGDFGPRGEVTKLIEAGVRLIAVDQTASGDAAQAVIARTVTVAINPQQVASLAQAQSTGRLSLSLVGAEDDTVAEAVEVDQRALLGIEARTAPEPEAAPEKVCTIRTRRGAEVIEIPIPCTN